QLLHVFSGWGETVTYAAFSRICRSFSLTPDKSSHGSGTGPFSPEERLAESHRVRAAAIPRNEPEMTCILINSRRPHTFFIAYSPFIHESLPQPGNLLNSTGYLCRFFFHPFEYRCQVRIRFDVGPRLFHSFRQAFQRDELEYFGLFNIRIQQHVQEARCFTIPVA